MFKRKVERGESISNLELMDWLSFIEEKLEEIWRQEKTKELFNVRREDE